VKRAALVLFAVVAGCTPLESIDHFDGEFGAAREKRRLVALVSPT
jgi:hypothetical protein